MGTKQITALALATVGIGFGIYLGIHGLTYQAQERPYPPNLPAQPLPPFRPVDPAGFYFAGILLVFIMAVLARWDRMIFISLIALGALSAVIIFSDGGPFLLIAIVLGILTAGKKRRPAENSNDN